MFYAKNESRFCMIELVRALDSILGATVDLIRDPCEAVNSAASACRAAAELGNRELALKARFMLYRAVAACTERPNYELFEDIWRDALQFAERKGARTVILGSYVVALASSGRYAEVEKVLAEWGSVLDGDASTALVTYALLAVFDGKYAERAMKYLPADARADLLRYAAALQEAVEREQFSSGAEESSERGTNIVAELLALSFLGIALCRRGEAWGLTLAKVAASALDRMLRAFKANMGDYLRALEESKPGDCAPAVSKAVRVYYQLA